MSTQVKSQTRDLPSFQGKSVKPSGLFPSLLDSPGGSLTAGTPADAKALLIRSLQWECLGCLPAAFLQDRPCLPSMLTLSPQIQVCLWHSGAPRRRETAILRLVLSSFKPRLTTGMAFSQSEECSEAAASNLAFSVELS